MKDRTPVPRDQRPALPDFTPVPRRYRHDGWTPERQKAFIEALADTGSVSRAAAMTNMTPESAYYLRRQAGADEFRRAWEAALDYGVARMKDIAFERAIEGYLVPCFAGGKLLGWRRKYNDRLLMFVLRHYGEDANGRRTKVEYFSTRATAGAAALSSPPLDGEGHGGGVTQVQGATASGALAETSHTTVRTITTGRGTAPSLDSTTDVIEDFAGVDLDETAQAEIYQVLQDCAARRRAIAGTPDDPDELFISVEQEEREVLVRDEGYARPRRVRRRPKPLTDVVVEADAFLEQSVKVAAEDPFRSSAEEMPWQILDDEEQCDAIESAVESVKAARALPLPPAGEGRGEGTECGGD